MAQGQTYRGYRSAWSFDAHAAHHPAWMAAVPDETNLTSLSIPGTHDTMTYGLLRPDPVLNCQNWNLSVQLDAGLRYVDIRARLADRWGARPVRGGKAVWCEFDTPITDVGRRGAGEAQALSG